MLCHPHIFYRFLLCSPFTMICFITAVYDDLPPTLIPSPFTMFYCQPSCIHRLRCFTVDLFYHAFAVYHVLPLFRPSPFTNFLRNFYEVFTNFFGSRTKAPPTIDRSDRHRQTPQTLAETGQKSEGSEGDFRLNVTYS